MKTLLSLAAVLAAFAYPAAAQGQNCAPRDQVVEHLGERYGETRQSIGLASNNTMVETWASNESGSWTITVTMPNGIACLVASGQSFERLDEELPAAEGDTF